MKEPLKWQGWEGRGETVTELGNRGTEGRFKTWSSVGIFDVLDLVLVGVNWNLVPIWDLRATVRKYQTTSGRS